MTEKLLWWMKTKPVTEVAVVKEKDNEIPLTLQQVSEISNSLVEFLEKEQKITSQDDSETDIGSIIEEINRIAAQSPLGPFEKEIGDRSIEDIIREAEKIYLDSSKSFEQLNSCSKNLNLTGQLNSALSITPTATPKGVSPLPLDDTQNKEEIVDSQDETYSEDFSQENSDSVSSPSVKNFNVKLTSSESSNSSQEVKEARIEEKIEMKDKSEEQDEEITSQVVNANENDKDGNANGKLLTKDIDTEIKQKKEENDCMNLGSHHFLSEIRRIESEINKKEEIIDFLHGENKKLKEEIESVRVCLRETTLALEKTKSLLNTQNTSNSSDVNIERVLDELKDAKEINTALQIQLENVTKTHNSLKINYEDVISANKLLEKRVSEAEELLLKYKTELLNLQKHRDRLIDSETNLNQLLEVERIQNKTLKTQNEKDAKCIQDLNRQIKEMERIIARKHPDSVSALIVAAKNDQTESNLTARKVLEDRIISLESEVSKRDYQSSMLFLEIQEKFNQMKAKYESHIEDLELHVSDLKNQLKRKTDCYDMYTQTFLDEQKIPEKETKNIGIQTDYNKTAQMQIIPKTGTTKRTNDRHNEPKEETHLLATIRGLQTDVLNKERAIIKLNKEIEELKKTNRRLQKEREGSLKNLAERREFRSYPEKLAVQVRSNSSTTDLLEEELRNVKNERDKMRQQLYKIEEDYQSLKEKRLQDLTTLQEAHEREISTYLANIAPLQEQLEVQQVTINSLQNQLKSTKEELAVTSVERDHLYLRLSSNSADPFTVGYHHGDGDKAELTLPNKISFLEKSHIEREQRLRAIILGLAQKNVMNINCEQCAARQKQLIMYKNELDQLMITLRALN